MSVKRLTSRIGASCWAGIIFCVALGLVMIRSGENRHASAGQALQGSALAAVARQQKPDGKSSAKLNPKARAMVAEAYGRLPLSFEVNHGQVDMGILRMQQAGVVPVGYSNAAIEILADNAAPEAEAVYAALGMPFSALVFGLRQYYSQA